MSDARYAKYTEGVCGDGAAILKDGHTMFIGDVVKDLNRKSFLEAEKERLQHVVDGVVNAYPQLESIISKYLEERND